MDTFLKAVILLSGLAAVAFAGRLPLHNYSPLQNNFLPPPSIPFGLRDGGYSKEVGIGGRHGGYTPEFEIGGRHGGYTPEFGIFGRPGGYDSPEIGIGNRLGGYGEFGIGGPIVDEIPRYEFEYAVADEYTNNNFGQQETRDGYDTKGSYFVLLPDGRKQIVNYYVSGDSGYVAEVTYEGEAIYLEPNLHHGHGPLPRPIPTVFAPPIVNKGYQPDPYNIPSPLLRPVPIPRPPQERFGYNPYK